MSKDYSQKALMWAEQYGIVNYKVKGNKMVYNVSFPATMFEPHYTVQRIIDLDLMKTVESKRLKRYDSKGNRL